MAEYYHIYDIYQFDALYIAVLFLGLREDSRTKKLESKTKYSLETQMLAMITDYLAWLVWSKSKDGIKNINRPESIVNQLLGVDKEEQEEVMTFSSSEEFEEILKKAKGV